MKSEEGNRKFQALYEVTTLRRQPQLHAIVRCLRKRASALSGTSQDTCAASLFCAKWPWGDPVVGNLGRVGPTALRS